MVDKSRRKELMREYAERPPSAGVFAVKCAATDEAWVGWSKSLDKRQNGMWFQLRAGGLPAAPDLAAAWKTHGEGAFRFEILEAISEDNPYKLELLLEERTTHWRGKLNGKAIVSR
jgi:hypothetical protein